MNSGGDYYSSISSPCFSDIILFLYPGTKLGEQLAQRRLELKMKLEGLFAVELGARYLALNACDAPDWQQQPELMSPAGVTLGEAWLCIWRTTPCFFCHELAVHERCCTLSQRHHVSGVSLVDCRSIREECVQNNLGCSKTAESAEYVSLIISESLLF